jgi:hypothetical protein
MPVGFYIVCSIVVGGAMLMLIINSVYWRAYRDGQIDAANKRVYWILREQADGSTKWIEKTPPFV